MKMPDSCTTQKGVEKVRLSLSLKQRRDENTNPTPGASQQKGLQKHTDKPPKRPFHDTYSNTLEAAKRLKLVNTTAKPVKVQCKPLIDLVVCGGAMLNGHHVDTQGGERAPVPVATLTNLGNTCFLNSVLYTLRFAPRFLHNLHHLARDLAAADPGVRLKTSSLGRGAAPGGGGAGGRSWSSKDLLALGQEGKTKIQVVTERLHETYVSLRSAETRNLGSSDSPEPYAADSFLSALREVNSTFEGNRQQDAHELLVCILDNLRETCQALRSRVVRPPHENGDSNGIAKSASIEPDSKSLGLRKSWKKKKDKSATETSPAEETAAPVGEEDARSKPGWDFVSEDFEGMTVLRTTCLECETVTERKQAMCDICVPLGEDDDDEPFRGAVSSECLRDQNKYWCERCLRYNEARRTVAYETLPRLLVLQLKRFSGGMEKITKHSPTPLELSCFCEGCARRPRDLRPHSYTLWAIIMHLGQALSGGHYIAYVKDGVAMDVKCSRDISADSSNTGSGGFMRNFFNRPRPQTSGCTAKECCSPRGQQEPTWLACDDDVVKPLTQEEFDDLLSPEPKLRSAATPYLLFYSKTEVG